MPIVHEPPSRYDVIIRVARDGGQLPDPVTFAVAADQAASRRSASIISVHTDDAIISVVTVTAPGRYAALAVARAVVSHALKPQAPSPAQLAARPQPIGVQSRPGKCAGTERDSGIPAQSSRRASVRDWLAGRDGRDERSPGVSMTGRPPPVRYRHACPAVTGLPGAQPKRLEITQTTTGEAWTHLSAGTGSARCSRAGRW